LRESRSKIHLSLLALLVMSVPLALFFYYYSNLMNEAQEDRPEARLVYELYEDDPVEEKLPEPVVVEASEFEVSGRACLPDGSGVPGLKLILAQESVVAGPDGSFHFPAAKRGRESVLRLELNGK